MRKEIASFGDKVLRACIGLCLLVPAATLVGPSDADALPRRGRTTDILGSQWEVLYPSEASMSITGDDPVLDRRYRNDAALGVYSEAMKLPGGNMLYEKRKGSATQENAPPEAELFRRYGSLRDLDPMGIKIGKESIRRISTDKGDIAVVTAESRTHRCGFFFHYANGSDGKSEGQSQALTGGLCAPASIPESSRIEAVLVDLVGRVLFDGGAYAYSQKFAEGLDQARRKVIEEETSYANDKTAPTLDIPARLSTAEPLLTVKGGAQDDVELAEVRVNGLWASVDGRGQFKLTVPVQAGQSEVSVVAKDRAGNVTRKTVAVTNTGNGPGRPLVKPLKSTRYHALVIANQNYRLDPKVESLDTAANDGRAVASVLKERYGFNVTLLEDARKADILGAFNKMAATLGPDDNLLIYYAGHGVAYVNSPDKPGFWIPVDGTSSNATNWLSNRTILRAINTIPAGHVMIVSDSCFSGTLTKEADIFGRRQNIHIRDAVERRTRTALSSGDVELVIDRLEPDDTNSVFTREFVMLLKNNPGIMSGQQMSNILRGNVRKRFDQTPQYGAVLSAGHDDGSDFFFKSRM